MFVALITNSKIIIWTRVSILYAAEKLSGIPSLDGQKLKTYAKAVIYYTETSTKTEIRIELRT